MALKMNADDFRIYHEGDDCIFLVAKMLSYSMEWPTYISHGNKNYKFECNELMQNWMIGNYSGHAKYIQSTVDEQQLLDHSTVTCYTSGIN